jgi:hypothetical protein
MRDNGREVAAAAMAFAEHRRTTTRHPEARHPGAGRRCFTTAKLVIQQR